MPTCCSERRVSCDRPAPHAPARPTIHSRAKLGHVVQAESGAATPRPPPLLRIRLEGMLDLRINTFGFARAIARHTARRGQPFVTSSSCGRHSCSCRCRYSDRALTPRLFLVLPNDESESPIGGLLTSAARRWCESFGKPP